MTVFDSFQGLPIHALVLHATVVLLPLMALATVVTAFVPRLRLRLAWPLAVADLGVVALVWFTAQTGEAFQRRLEQTTGRPVALDHARLGKQLVFFAVGLFVAAVLVALTRRSRRAVLSAVLALAAGAGLTWWTVLVGHSGAVAVWGGMFARR